MNCTFHAKQVAEDEINCRTGCRTSAGRFPTVGRYVALLQGRLPTAGQYIAFLRGGCQQPYGTPHFCGEDAGSRQVCIKAAGNEINSLLHAKQFAGDEMNSRMVRRISAGRMPGVGRYVLKLREMKLTVYYMQNSLQGMK